MFFPKKLSALVRPQYKLHSCDRNALCIRSTRDVILDLVHCRQLTSSVQFITVARGGGKGTRGKSSKNFNSTDNASKTHKNELSCTISSHTRPSSHSRPPHFHRVVHLPPIPPTGPHGPPPPHSRAASRCLATNSCAAAGLRKRSAVPLTPSYPAGPLPMRRTPQTNAVLFPHPFRTSHKW